MHSYYLEFILNTYNASEELIKTSLAEFGEGLEILLLPQDNTGKGENFKVCISTQDPTVIFDICAQLGRIKTVRVNEERKA
jgi:dihydroxyacetone kinase-like predicted kinase